MAPQEDAEATFNISRNEGNLSMAETTEFGSRVDVTVSSNVGSVLEEMASLKSREPGLQSHVPAPR